MIGKLFAILASAILIACSSCSHSPVPDAPKTLSPPAVGRLVILDEDGDKEGYCTVWKASATLAVTAGHCCAKDKHYRIEGPNAIPGERIVTLVDNDDQDFCVFHAKMKGEPLKIAARDPAIGSRVWVAGYPKGYYMISEGYWSGRDIDTRNRAMYSIDAIGGYSGSPVMTADGKVCSILTEGYQGASVTFGTPIEQIRIAIKKARATPVPDEEEVGELVKPDED